jgi:soluble lytic murein transglycosylase-like protein
MLLALVMAIINFTTNLNAPQQTALLSPVPITEFATPINAPEVLGSATTISPSVNPIPTASASAEPTAQPTIQPKIQPTIHPISKIELEKLLTEYADQYKIDKEQLKNIAQCESGLNPKATNMYYGGLFQFSPQSWKGYRRLMGKRTDPELRFDPEAAVNTAAYMISTGRTSAWPNCK